jgi:hypothetical protein
MSLLIELIQSAGSPSAVRLTLVALFTPVIIFSADYIALIINSEKVANLILKGKKKMRERKELKWGVDYTVLIIALEGNKICFQLCCHQNLVRCNNLKRRRATSC